MTGVGAICVQPSNLILNIGNIARHTYIYTYFKILKAGSVSMIIEEKDKKDKYVTMYNIGQQKIRKLCGQKCVSFD